MEEFLANAFNTGDIKIIAVAAIVYVIIYLQRNNTKKSRDDDREKMATRIVLLEEKVEKIEELDLSSKLASIMTDLNWIKQKLMEKK